MYPPTTETYTSVHTLSLHDALPILAVDDHGIDLAGIERRRGTIGIAEGTSDILKLTRWAEARARRAEPRGDVAGIVQAVAEQVILDDRPGQLSDPLVPLVLNVIIVREQRVGRIRIEIVRHQVEDRKGRV